MATETFSKKANRDAAAAAARAQGKVVRVSSSRGLNLMNPKYVRDSGRYGEPHAFGDDVQAYGTLYLLTVEG